MPFEAVISNGHRAYCRNEKLECHEPLLTINHMAGINLASPDR
jgi:hypothetical protein